MKQPTFAGMHCGTDSGYFYLGVCEVKTPVLVIVQNKPKIVQGNIRYSLATLHS